MAMVRGRYDLGEAFDMQFIEEVVDGFILTVGITPPQPEKKRTATIFIATGLLGTVAGVAALFVFVVTHLFIR
jgi:hypothetical protein